MKRGGGINGRDDKSSGIDIRMADALAKINPTDPLISVMPHRTTARAVNSPHNRTCGTCGKRAVGGFFFFKYTSKIEMSSQKNAGF
jgi:hypothetical protein